MTNWITSPHVCILLLTFWKLTETCIICVPPRRRPQPTPPPPRPTRPPTPPTHYPTPTTTPTTLRPTTTVAPTPPWNHDIPPVIYPNADDEPVPFVAAIATPNEDPFCSASVISLHFVVSACMRCLQKRGRPLAPTNIRIITPDFSEDDDAGIGIAVYEVQRVSVHPQCLTRGLNTTKNDIGIVQTLDEIETASKLGFARVPPTKGFQASINKNWLLSAVRWKNTMATTLVEAVWFVKVRAVPRRVCSDVLNSSFYDVDTNYCTPYQHDGRTDACQDDFGAPLSMANNLLIGVLIHKFDCGGVGDAASFVNVAYNRNWLKRIVQKLSDGAESV